MNNKISLKTISLKDLWNVLRGCFWFVLAAGIVFTVGMYAYAKLTYSPLYSSKGTMYLINTDAEVDKDNPQSQNQWTYEYTLANVVISDTIYILQSRTVLDNVGKEIGINNGYNALSGSISIFHPEDTRVLEITAVASTPENAKKIVDSLCKYGPEEANNVLQYDRIRVYEEGTYSNWAINQISFISYVKYGIIGGGLVYIIFLAMFLFDNYIHTEEDIERYLGISILGDIPDADAPRKKNKYTNYKKSYKQASEKNYYGTRLAMPNELEAESKGESGEEEEK